MRIDHTTDNSDLLAVLQELHAGGAVVDVLTSDLELWAMTGRRKPTIIYRPSAESPDHVWLQCPEISGEDFDDAMDAYEVHWQVLMSEPLWREWAATHPIPDDVVRS